MAHSTSRRRGATRDETYNRLPAATFGFVGEELRSVLFGRTADFTDHDDRLGLVVGEEHLEHVDELRALHRVAADTDRCRLAEAFVCGLEHRLVGERARAADNADAALLEDVARHDSDLALVRREHAGAVRANQARLRAVERPLHADHVKHRNPLGDRYDQRNLGVDRLEDGIRCERRRHVDDRGIRAGLLDRLAHRIEHGQTEVGGAALTGRHSTHHLRAVIERLARVERAGLAGHPLGDDLRVPIDKYAHWVGIASVGLSLFQLTCRIVYPPARVARAL